MQFDTEWLLGALLLSGICILVSGIVALIRQHYYEDTFHSVATFLCGNGFGIFSSIWLYIPFLLARSMAEAFGATIEAGETGLWGCALLFSAPFVVGAVVIGWVGGICLSIPLLIYTCKTVEEIGYNDEKLLIKILRMVICLIIQVVVLGVLPLIFLM